MYVKSGQENGAGNTDVNKHQTEAVMQENDVYKGGDVTAEYDVYTGSANQNVGKGEVGNENNPYDFYAGSTPVCLAVETVPDDVIMTENDVFSKD